MGISLSKVENPLIQEGFDGQSSDYTIGAENFKQPFGPEWLFHSGNLAHIKEDLQSLTNLPENIPMFSLENRIIAAKCVSCYDGDTINLVFKHDGEYIRYRCRMIGYNSPEMRGVSLEERNRAIVARDYLANRLLDKKVIARFGPFDKYGRILVDIYLIENENNITLENAFNTHINQEMINKGYGVVYRSLI